MFFYPFFLLEVLKKPLPPPIIFILLPAKNAWILSSIESLVLMSIYSNKMQQANRTDEQNCLNTGKVKIACNVQNIFQVLPRLYRHNL